LAIKEPLGNRAGMAISYHNMGAIAQDRGDYDAALDWYRKSLAIAEQLGDRAGMARSYHQLGNFSYLRGDYDAALDSYRKSLAIAEQLGHRAGMAYSYGQIGKLYMDAEGLSQGAPLILQSLTIYLEL
jgi:tetratricopeptide (TPR) repeat protein